MVRSSPSVVGGAPGASRDESRGPALGVRKALTTDGVPRPAMRGSARPGDCTAGVTGALGALLRGHAVAEARLDDHRLDRRGDAVVDLDDHHVGADVADRLLEVDLAAVDRDAAGVA